MNANEALLLSEARQKARSGAAKQVRERRGLSQAEVAAVIGRSRVTVFRWESGATRPTGQAGIRFGAFLRLLEEES